MPSCAFDMMSTDRRYGVFFLSFSTPSEDLAMASKLEVRMPRLAVIPGSSREGSLNVKLAKAAA